MADSVTLLESKIIFIVNWGDKYNILGVVEHGMLLKFISERGRALLLSLYANMRSTNKQV